MKHGGRKKAAEHTVNPRKPWVPASLHARTHTYTLPAPAGALHALFCSLRVRLLCPELPQSRQESACAGCEAGNPTIRRCRRCLRRCFIAAATSGHCSFLWGPRPAEVSASVGREGLGFWAALHRLYATVFPCGSARVVHTAYRSEELFSQSSMCSMQKLFSPQFPVLRYTAGALPGEMSHPPLAGTAFLASAPPSGLPESIRVCPQALAPRVYSFLAIP